MMRLQRGPFRSDATSAGIGAAGDGSVLGLILGLVFAAGAGEAVTGFVESGVGALSATPAARTGGTGSGSGTVPGDACESTTVFSDVGGAAACFGVAGGTVVSIAA